VLRWLEFWASLRPKNRTPYPTCPLCGEDWDDDFLKENLPGPFLLHYKQMNGIQIVAGLKETIQAQKEELEILNAKICANEERLAYNVALHKINSDIVKLKGDELFVNLRRKIKYYRDEITMTKIVVKDLEFALALNKMRLRLEAEKYGLQLQLASTCW
jgi:hypothetical protein